MTHTERTTTRTYRAAVRLGEDFITLEETITLPIDATDADVQAAVDLGWRIYRAQRESVEQQIAQSREGRPAGGASYTVKDPDAPASEKQRGYMDALRQELGWDGAQLAAYAAEQSVDLESLTKGQASTFIDGLKKVVEERRTQPAPNRTPPAQAGNGAAEAKPGTASPAQMRALANLAQKLNLDYREEMDSRFGFMGDPTVEEASALIQEWQKLKPAAEPTQRRVARH